MRFIRLLTLLSLLVLFGLLSSCDKYRAKKLSGTYYCSVNYHYTDISPETIDSTYNEDIIIEQDDKDVIVLGTSINIDSLWKEKEYFEGNYNDFLQVLFRNDSVYIQKYSGGLGGSSSLTYKGLKE